MEFDLYFQAVEEEVNRKNESMFVLSSDSEDTFWSYAFSKLQKKDISELKSASNFAKNLKSIDPNHPSSKAYFIHAIRVATHTLASLKKPNVEIVKMAMIHNVFEITGLSRLELAQAGFSDYIIDAIELQTVDRSRQFDEDYLLDYYSSIKSFGKGLMFLRCMDKLDNLLAFELIADGSIRTNWLKNTHDHVIPMAYLLDEKFGSYFSGVFDYIENRGCIESKRLEFDELQKTRAIN